MGRGYGGVLGVLAFLAALLRGWAVRGFTPGVLSYAWCALLAGFAAGCLIGWLAGWIVEDSVRARLRTAVEAKRNSSPG
jgi:membrane associated rhomboid family serine protease